MNMRLFNIEIICVDLLLIRCSSNAKIVIRFCNEIAKNILEILNYNVFQLFFLEKKIIK